MVHTNYEYFDLPTLIKQGDFNIRQIAATGPSLSVDEYFNMLSKFMTLAPDVLNALAKFSDRNGDTSTYRSLDSMATLLDGLGCDKFIPDFYSILDAYEKGNWRLAATYAKRIINDFNGLCSRIKIAKMTKKSKALLYVENEDDPSIENHDTPDKTLSLEAFINRLDNLDNKEARKKEPSDLLDQIQGSLDNEEVGQKSLILAVDDSPVILKTVSSVLSNDYKVFTLLKPTMLENLLKQITPELFLLDYKMPELNGFELIPIIRSFEAHKETPIIFLTSEGSIDNVTAALGLGACDFIVKPFKPDALREKIKKHIVRKKIF